MGTIKNDTGHPIEVTHYDIRVGEGQTFSVPDEDSSFDNRPGFTSSRTKNPDVVPDPAVVAALTGPVQVVAPATPGELPA